jgi:hypothetical protein
MTRKHYVALAGALADALPAGAERFDGWCRAVNAIADVLAGDNPRFDRERFVVACCDGNVDVREAVAR